MADSGQCGRSLREAIATYSDPEEWAEYERLSRAAAGKSHVGFFFFNDEPIAGWGAYDRAQRDNAAIDGRERAWRRLVERFLDRLRNGELRASGFADPVGPESRRAPIPPDLWSFLTPVWSDSSATGSGLRFVGVLVIHESAEPAAKSAEQQCGDWIDSEASKGVLWKKRDAFDEARRSVSGKLSQRAFDRAWASRAPDSWKRPGYKRKKPRT